MTPVSVYDDAIKKLVYQPIDVCMTEILVPGFYNFPWQAKLSSRKWSKLIRAARFRTIHDRANTVFMLLEEHGVFCPTISIYNPIDEKGIPAVGLKMEWRSDGRILRVFIAAGHLYHYSRGKDATLEINIVEDDEAFMKLLPVFARYICPPKERDGKHDCGQDSKCA